ncbi:MAG TPA: hypothetical protein VF974_01920 [Patescibacteria group bacterium]
MSSTSGSTKRSWASKLGLALFVIIVGWRGSIYALDYIYPQHDAGVRMVEENMDNIVEQHAGEVEDRTFAQKKRVTDNNGQIDLNKVDEVGSEAAGQVAKARLIHDAKIAEAKGLMLSHPPRFLAAYHHEWMATKIPIYNGCTKIWAAGKVSRDVYTNADPDGVNLAAMSPGDRKKYLEANGDKTTLLPGVPWGTFCGVVCNNESELANCGPQFPIGSSKYLTSAHVGAGYLWVILNGFVAGTAEGWLAHKPDLNMSDYNVYKGGFTFDQLQVAAQACEAHAVITPP